MSTLPKTDVPWATKSWPILRGCSECSTGCLHCYAKTYFRRFGKRLGWEWGKPIFFPENRTMPLSTRKPQRIFVAPMSDLFHPGVDPEWRKEIYRIMAGNPQHVFVVLTKRPENIPGGYEIADNIWIGVSAENQEQYDRRWPELCRRVKARVLFVSAEPMLSPIVMQPAFGCYPDWVQCGPETGTGKRPCDPRWIEDLWNQCKRANIPFFDKQEPYVYAREYPRSERGDADAAPLNATLHLPAEAQRKEVR